jgi:hypothetical protein
MRTRLRITTSILIAMLFLLSFVGQTYAHSSIQKHTLMPLSLPSPLYNNVTLSKPNWWIGTNSAKCDDAYYYANSTPHTHSFQLGTNTNYRGVKACGPMPIIPGNPPDVGVNFYTGAPTENEWECTELVKRYLYQAFGAKDEGNTFGKDVVTNYAANDTLFKSYANNATPNQLPVAGDVLSFNELVPGDHGHTAIVTAVSVDSNGNGTLTMIEQNNSHDSNGIGTLYVGNPTSLTNPNGYDPGNPAWNIDTEKGYLGTVSGWLDTQNPVNSADPTIYENVLSAVTTASTNSWGDVWAIGHTQLQNGIHQALTEHWDGSSWTANNYLYGVAALSTTNVWAVGYYLDSTGSPQTLLEQYNGTSWTAQTQGGGQLFGITAVSSSEAWAVGIGSDGNALTLHLANGTWTTQSNPPTQTVLTSVSAVSTSNVMAVGYTNFGNTQSVALVWNGASWVPTNPVPPNPSGLTRLSGVYALDANHIYVIGSTDNESEGFITMWNGSSWSSPSYGPSNSSFSSVEALSSTNIWIVGGANSSTLVYQFDGSTLNQITSPNVGNSSLNGVTINPSNGNVWAVGNGTVNSFAQTLTEFFN